MSSGIVPNSNQLKQKTIMKGVYKFNPSANATLESLQNSRPYILREKINNGEKLTADDKRYIAKSCMECAFFDTSIALMGWCFDFSDVLSRFLINSYGSWSRVYAFNKTQVRKIVYGKIHEIICA